MFELFPPRFPTARAQTRMVEPEMEAAGIEPAQGYAPNVPVCRDSARSAYADGPWGILPATGYSSSVGIKSAFAATLTEGDLARVESPSVSVEERRPTARDAGQREEMR